MFIKLRGEWLPNELSAEWAEDNHGDYYRGEFDIEFAFVCINTDSISHIICRTDKFDPLQESCSNEEMPLIVMNNGDKIRVIDETVDSREFMTFENLVNLITNIEKR